VTREPCDLSCDCDLCRVEAECLRLRAQVAADHDTILTLEKRLAEARHIASEYAISGVQSLSDYELVTAALRRWDAESDPCAAWDARNG